MKVAVKNIARILGDDVSEETPILDARLPDGSRVAAVFPPCSLGGTTLTIRKFHVAVLDVRGTGPRRDDHRRISSISCARRCRTATTS